MNFKLTDLTIISKIRKTPPYLIKADIEGDELEMLYGATEIIKEYKPKIAICLYHFFEDFSDIPLYLKQIVPEYKFAVRTHTNVYEETVLYAYCKSC